VKPFQFQKIKLASSSRASHLSSMQGAGEERTELYGLVLRRSTAAGNAAVSQEPSLQPASAGWQDGGAEGVR